MNLWKYGDIVNVKKCLLAYIWKHTDRHMGNAPYVCLKNIKYAYSYFEERCEKDDFMAIKIEDFLHTGWV